MALLRNMDLYKGIVLLSLVLLPLGGWWVRDLQEQIDLSRIALANATRRGGLLEKIGQLQKKIETVAQNQRFASVVIDEPTQYFEGQILTSNASLATTDFSLAPPREVPERIGNRQRVTDHVVRVDWKPGREQKAFDMSFVYAVAFNCESGAASGTSGIASPSVWRLYKLELDNSTNAQDVRAGKVPDAELDDTWLIKEMEFARREPRRK